MRLPHTVAAIVAVLNLGFVGAGEPASLDQQLQAAEALFKEGINAGNDSAKAQSAWRGAAAAYQKIVEAGFDSPDLFLNLGNAYLLADDLPLAVLAYRRGLHRHPLHSQLWENLEAARDMVGYTDGAVKHRPAGDDWPPFLPRPSSDSLLWIALALYTLAWLTISVWLVWRPREAVVIALGLLLAAGVSGLWWGHHDFGRACEEQEPVIVVAANGVTMRRGNGSLYPRHPELPVVNRGMEAKLLSERGGWLRLEFPGGEVGWLPRGAVVGGKW